jgi:hypothetical protein
VNNNDNNGTNSPVLNTNSPVLNTNSPVLNTNISVLNLSGFNLKGKLKA